jgi:hypothetical protein
MSGTSWIALLAQAAPKEDENLLFLGDDFMPWMVLAFGAALVVGNGLALVRPPKSGPTATRSEPGRTRAPERPPLARSLVMIGIGLLAAGWGLASLLS